MTVSDKALGVDGAAVASDQLTWLEAEALPVEAEALPVEAEALLLEAEALLVLLEPPMFGVES